MQQPLLPRTASMGLATGRAKAAKFLGAAVLVFTALLLVVLLVAKTGIIVSRSCCAYRPSRVQLLSRSL